MTSQALLFVLTTAIGVAMSQNGHWFRRDATNHSYFVSTTEKNWKDASFDCYTKGGYLATISDSEEDNYVNGIIEDTESITTWSIPPSYWIGLISAFCPSYSSCSDWVWQNGEPLSYQNWYRNNPNRSGGEGKSFVAKIYVNLQWYNDRYNYIKRYVCEVTDPCTLPDMWGPHGQWVSNENITFCCACSINTQGDSCEFCNPGHSGPYCEDLNECLDSDKCVHGTCVNTIGSFICTCENGWYGVYCDNEEHEENEDEQNCSKDSDLPWYVLFMVATQSVLLLICLILALFLIFNSRAKWSMFGKSAPHPRQQIYAENTNPINAETNLHHMIEDPSTMQSNVSEKNVEEE